MSIKNITVLLAVAAMGVTGLQAQIVVDGGASGFAAIGSDANDLLDEANAGAGWIGFAAGTPENNAWDPVSNAAVRDTSLNSGSARGLGQINAGLTNPFATGSYTFTFDYTSSGSTGMSLQYELWSWENISGNPATGFGSGQRLNLANTNIPGDGSNWDVTPLVSGTIDLGTSANGNVTQNFSVTTALGNGDYWGVRFYTENLSGSDSAAISNVTIIPEPGSLALLGLGATALLLRRRR